VTARAGRLSWQAQPAAGLDAGDRDGESIEAVSVERDPTRGTGVKVTITGHLFPRGDDTAELAAAERLLLG
jgi:hypothetical protein